MAARIARKTGSFLGAGALAIALGAAGVMLAGPTAVAQSDRASGSEAFSVDETHASVLFRVSHLNIAPFYGRFNDISGTFFLDEDNPRDSIIDITVRTDSVDTNNQKRDDHLRSPDFFNVKQFPVATFKSTSVRNAGDDAFRVTGDLTINGKTNEITIDVDKTGEGSDPWGGYRSGFETSFEISRMDYGVSYMPEGLGETVKMIIALEGVRK